MAYRMSGYQRVALRCWVDYPRLKPKKRRKPRKRKPIHRILVIDTETTVDETQRLLFGSARYVRLHRTDGVVTAVLQEEWLFHDDDLPTTDPDGYATLSRYASKHNIPLLSRSDFVQQILWKGAYLGGMTVVGFNLPFDLSRLALHVGEINVDSYLAGGFSFALWGREAPDGSRWQDHKWRPRLWIKKVGPGRAFIQWAPAWQRDKGVRAIRGDFLDVHTLDAALSGSRRSLKRGCEAWELPDELSKSHTEEHGVISDDYIDYNRQDVTATAHLCAALLTELERHTDLALHPTQVFSPASITKAYMRATGVDPPLDRWPDTPEHNEVLHASMHAYTGGLTETLDRRELTPVVPVDFLSMYPTEMELLGVWDYLIAERIEIEDYTAELQALLDHIAADGPDVLRDPSLWRSFVGYAWTVPDGNLLPVRSPWDQPRPQLGVHPFTLPDAAVPYATPDLVGAAVRGQRAPKVLRALRLVPIGKQAGLRSVRFRGELDYNASTQSLPKALIEFRKEAATRPGLTPEERRRLDRSLKLIANSLYGITVEFNRRPVSTPEPAIIHRLDGPWSTNVDAVELPGPFCDPPIGSCITAAGRLMLGLAERVAADHGLRFALSDTDSLALISNTGGPPDPDAVRAVQDWFEPLHPYDRGKVPQPLLEIDVDSTDGLGVFAISPKRYSLSRHTDGGIEIVKGSESGLGHLLDPTRVPDPDPDIPHSDTTGNRGWIDELHRWAIQQAAGTEMPDPDWFDHPAISRISITSWDTLQHFENINRGRSYGDSIKPFNFAITATPDPRAAAALGRERIRLIAPLQPDLQHAAAAEWIDVESGDTCWITTDPGVTEIICEHPIARDPDDNSPELVPVKSYRIVAQAWATNPIPKATGLDGSPVDETITGRLRRRPLHSRAALITYIGKESDRIDDLQAGLIDQDTVLTTYTDHQRVWNELIAPAARAIGADAIADTSGLHPSTVRRTLSSHAPPKPSTRTAIQRAANRHAKQELRQRGESVPKDIMATLQRVLDVFASVGMYECEHCGEQFRPSRNDAKHCSDACRKKAWRARAGH